ncbi:MAG TPA: PQQ-dependent sugar dehydrogenase [Acidimicrobiia bacterium]|jgi:glucose/arabinose dehydrogenase|nr:PQQ-dependent sugar dehydrogenase [Acidimicrobiia bacterium]
MRSSRRPRTPFVALLALLVLVALAAAACSDDGGSGSSSRGSSSKGGSGKLASAKVKLTPIARVEAPTAFATRQGDRAFYITEQVGRVRAVRDGNLDAQPVLDLTDRVGSGGERGLLGLTFSADGSKLYVHYTDKDGDTRVDEYAMSGNAADAGSRREILAVDQPQANHNGGQLSFGPDRMLYLGLGDGGGAGDQGSGHAEGGNGQSLDTLLGKILRIDPRASGGREYTIPPDNPFANGGGLSEIWAYGLRNPWRFSWDGDTNDLWIADVGQNQWEEVDFVAGGRAAGLNFGWNRLEGTHQFSGQAPANAVPPIYEYSHDGGGCSVSGGYVYRGAKIPDLRGAYVFSDYCDSALRAITQKGGELADQRDLGARSNQVAAFGQDQDGELYVLSQGDGLQRLDPA